MQQRCKGKLMLTSIRSHVCLGEMNQSIAQLVHSLFNLTVKYLTCVTVHIG